MSRSQHVAWNVRRYQQRTTRTCCGQLLLSFLVNYVFTYLSVGIASSLNKEFAVEIQKINHWQPIFAPDHLDVLGLRG